MNRFPVYIPRDAVWLLQKLRGAGHTAYVVGGCVRDSLLGRTPGDWDICTSAKPEEMRRLFADKQLILTGEKHGTVAVVLGIADQAFDFTHRRAELDREDNPYDPFNVHKRQG